MHADMDLINFKLSIRMEKKGHLSEMWGWSEYLRNY